MSTDFSGSYIRIATENFDPFWSLMGMKWMKRKIAANTPVRKVIVQNGSNIKETNSIGAGVLNISCDYFVHDTEEEALDAEDRGEVGKITEGPFPNTFVCWWEDGIMMQKRLFSNRNTMYCKVLLEDDKLIAHLTGITQKGEKTKCKIISERKS